MTSGGNGIQRVELADGYSVPPVIQGCWQLSAGHSSGGFNEQEITGRLIGQLRRGFDTFDCADIYQGVEELLGRVRRRAVEELGAEIRFQIHTKFVPDLEVLARIDRRHVERIIDRSLRRLGVGRLDLVQFYWWDTEVPGCLEVAGWLDELRQAGKIRHLGTTNFDALRLGELLDAGIPLMTNQVQYSVLDRRPQRTLVDLCVERGVQLVCYGVLAGGFVNERHLAQPAPEAIANRSLIKYGLVIEELGGWERFQELLEALSEIGRRYGVSLSSVAARYILDRAGVAAVILGVGGQDRDHRPILKLTLDQEDCERLESVLEGLPVPSGDVYELERDRSGRHGQIMKYNLNEGPLAR